MRASVCLQLVLKCVLEPLHIFQILARNDRQLSLSRGTIDARIL